MNISLQNATKKIEMSGITPEKPRKRVYNVLYSDLKYLKPMRSEIGITFGQSEWHFGASPLDGSPQLQTWLPVNCSRDGPTFPTQLPVNHTYLFIITLFIIHIYAYDQQNAYKHI